MCSHPNTVKRVRYVIIRGYRVRQTVCRACHALNQRNTRAIKRAFQWLVRMPAP